MHSGACVRTLILLVAVDALAADSAVAGRPSTPPRTTPGKKLGELESRWVAPYVRLSREGVGGRWTSTVRWFAEDGTVVRELAGSLDARAGYVTEYTQVGDTFRATYHATNDDWVLVLPRKGGP